MNGPGTGTRYADTRTSSVRVTGATLTHRTLGPAAGGPDTVPLVALTHLGATLDSWDASLLDSLAQDRVVVALGYRGVGGSGGPVAPSIEAMAQDVIAAVAALGHQRVDLFGMSMGGMVAQAVLDRAPALVERAVLAGSGPPGGPGAGRLRRAMLQGAAAALVRRTDPRAALFFTSTPTGREAARRYLARNGEPRVDREPTAGPSALRTQSGAVTRWGRRPPPGPSPFTGPVWIVHGDADRLVPPANVVDLARVLPQAETTVFPDSGHGVVFQHHLAVAERAREFLRR